MGFMGPNGDAVVNTSGSGTYAGAEACERSSSHVPSEHIDCACKAKQSIPPNQTGEEPLWW